MPLPAAGAAPPGMIRGMVGTALRHAAWIGLLALGVAVAARAEEFPPRVDDAPAPVLTDTTEYCLDLANRADAQHGVSDVARQLASDGRHMCEQGHILAGIARLRRALMMLHEAALPGE